MIAGLVVVIGVVGGNESELSYVDICCCLCIYLEDLQLALMLYSACRCIG